MTCSGVRQRPTVRDAQPGIIDAALHRSRPVAPVGTGLRSLPATTSVPTARSTRASAERRSSPSGTAGIGLDVGPGVCPHLGADPSTGTVDCRTVICPWHGLRLAGDWEFGWTTCPLTTTVYWRGCGWTPWAAKHRWTFRLFRSGPPAAAARRHPAGRGLRARRHHRQPARLLARRGVPPYSFTHLDVLTAPPVDDGLAEDADRFLVAVTFQIGRLRIPVVAEFTSPEPRTIVVRIVDGRRNRQRRRNPRHPGGSRRRQKATHRGIGSGHRSLGPDRLRPTAQGGCAPRCSCGCCPATSAGT
jgi:Domain of unknown function (DUF5914)/Rieske [2Fe-2S] domain